VPIIIIIIIIIIVIIIIFIHHRLVAKLGNGERVKKTILN